MIKSFEHSYKVLKLTKFFKKWPRGSLVVKHRCKQPIRVFDSHPLNMEFVKFIVMLWIYGLIYILNYVGWTLWCLLRPTYVCLDLIIEDALVQTAIINLLLQLGFFKKRKSLALLKNFVKKYKALIQPLAMVVTIFICCFFVTSVFYTVCFRCADLVIYINACQTGAVYTSTNPFSNIYRGPFGPVLVKTKLILFSMLRRN